MSAPKLCYVSGAWAYFTTQDVSQQWGDDWNDAPYEHNAGTPYEWHEHDKKQGRPEWRIVRLAWEGPFDVPSDWTINSPWSVEAINRGEVAWLRSPKHGPAHGITIFAGTEIPEFIERVEAVGGKVWLEREREVESVSAPSKEEPTNE